MRGWVKKIIDNYLDYKSFKTNRKLLVIESDDWGSLRTKDVKTREALQKINRKASKDIYIQYDSIATAEDLTALMDVLTSVKDKNGNPACLTANVCTANPDFNAIKESGFNQFFYIPFTDTLKDFSKNQDIFSIWKEGIFQKAFIPQLHGREHVHGLAWLEELKAGNQQLHEAFKLEAWGIPYKASTRQKRNNLQASLDKYGLMDEEDYHKSWVTESVDIFYNSFKKKPISFIAPAYTWHDSILKTIAECGIQTLQGIKLQYQPIENNNNYDRKPNYIGKKDSNTNLTYTVRNAFYEPDTNPDKDWVDYCLSGVQNAFRKKNPVIIGSHRLNYIGRLDAKHRDKNLIVLKKILQTIIKNYPDVEFIHSGQLAEIIGNS